MALPAREHYGATLVPVRTAEGGGLEVLLGQNPVVDFVKSSSASGAGVSIRSYPGELRFLGSRAALDEDSTPLDTAVRDLAPAGWPDMLATIPTIVSSPASSTTAARIDVRPALFFMNEKSGDECDRLYCFVCAVGGASQDDSLTVALNEQMHSQLEACEAYGEEFFQLSRQARAALTPKLRRLEWRKVDEVRKEAAADREFVNTWQKEMFRRHGVKKRQVAWATVRTLDKLSNFYSAEEVLMEARRYENEFRSALSVRDPWDITACLPNLSELVVMSYNLNVLPYGAHFFGSGQGTASSRRLAVFLNRLEAQSDEHRPDIFAIQELFSTPFLPMFCQQAMVISRMARLGYTAVTGGTPSWISLVLKQKWTDSGLVIFSRLPIAASGEVMFASGVGLDASASKGAIWARVRLAPGKFLDVFNCHLQATHTGDGDFDAVRQQQLSSLRDFICGHIDGQPYVLTGDFNVDAIAEPHDPRGAFGYALRPPSPESDDYKAMLRVLDPYDELTDVLLVSRSDQIGVRPAHPCTRPPRQHFPRTATYMIKHKHPQRLDYVFFRPTMSSLVEHVKSDVEEFKVSGHKEFTYLSDHWGIRSRFRIKCGFMWKNARVEGDSADPNDQCISPVYKRLLGMTHVLVLSIVGMVCLLILRHTSAFVFSCCTLLALAASNFFFAFGSANTRRLERKPTSGQGESSMPAQANNPYDAFARSMLRHCSQKCLGSRTRNADGTPGEYQWLTYEQVHRRVLLLASGLQHEFSLRSTSKVGLLGDSCAEWMFADLALMQCGVQTICLLNLDGLDRNRDSVESLDLLLCSSAWVEYGLDKNLEIGIPVVAFEPLSARLRARAQARSWTLIDIPYCVELADVKGLVSQGYSASWATFTSMPCWGSTDAESPNQAHVLISMQQLAQKAATVASALELVPDDIHFSYQSPAWIGERVLLHAILAAGGGIGFFQGVRSPRVFDDIKTLHPTFLTGTPNVFSDQLRQLKETQGSWLGFLSRICFTMQASFLDRGRPAPYMLDLLLRGARRRVLGTLKPRFILILCTPTQACTEHGFCRWLRNFATCRVLKSLVVAEAAGLVTLGEAQYKGGSVKNFAVGQTLPYVDLSIESVPSLGISPADLRCDELGRMVIHGPSLVHGGTLERFDSERQVHSGASTDVLVGRRGSAIFVFGRLSTAGTLPGGRRVLLDAMEQLCAQHAGRWLSQLFLTERGGVLVGIAAVQPEHLWREANFRNLCGGECMGNDELCQHNAVRAWCLEDLKQSCCGLDLGLPLERLHLVVEPFCCENGLQTPTFQLQRTSLEERFADVIGRMVDSWQRLSS